MKTRVSLLVLFALLAAGKTASAENVGLLGWNDGLTLTIVGGYMRTKIHEESPPSSDPYFLSGQLWLLRFQGGWYMGETRFRSLMGAEFLLSVGAFTPSALGRDKEEQKQVTLRNFFIDFDVGLNIAILRWGTDRNVFAGRFSLLGGGGLSSDLAYLFAGGRLVIMLYPGIAHFEAAYKVLPVTHGWSGDHAFEHRPSGTLIFDVGDDFRMGVGAEVWLGRHKDEKGVAPPQRALKGDYRLFLGTLSFRWK